MIATGFHDARLAMIVEGDSTAALSLGLRADLRSDQIDPQENQRRQMFDPMFCLCASFAGMRGSTMEQVPHGSAATTHALEARTQPLQASPEVLSRATHLAQVLQGTSFVMSELPVRGFTAIPQCHD